MEVYSLGKRRFVAVDYRRLQKSVRFWEIVEF